MVVYTGAWFIAPSPVRIAGGGWSLERVSVDGFEVVSVDDSATVLANDRFEMTLHRRVRPGAQPTIGLTAAWDGSDRVVLAEVRER